MIIFQVTNLNPVLNEPNVQFQNAQMKLPAQADFTNSNQQQLSNQTSLLPNPPGMLPNQPPPFINNKHHIPTNPPPISQTNTSGVGGQQQQQHNQNTNTSLVLRKVPAELNRPEIIRQHFIKFGQLLDVQCMYDGHQDATFIRFATNQQAFAAFKSPESILNNRFIRIHWLYHYQKMQNPNYQQQHHQQLGILLKSQKCR